MTEQTSEVPEHQPAGWSPVEPVDFPPRRVRTGPALIVISLVLVIMIGGGALALVGSSSTKGAAPDRGKQRGAGLQASSARQVLAPIIGVDEPPSDVISTLVVPAGTKLIGHADESGGVGMYDKSVELDVPANHKKIVRFYQLELAHLGWSQVSTAATSDGGTEVFATRTTTTGYYWEVGIIVEPVTPSISPALAGTPNSPSSSSVELRVFEVDDAD